MREDFVRAAAAIRRGEWSTYGDIAAASGRPRSARAVARAAAVEEDFPNAQRVLRADGSIARPSAAQVERTRLQLEDEGVGFRNDRAHPGQRVHWDELQRRLGGAGGASEMSDMLRRRKQVKLHDRGDG